MKETLSDWFGCTCNCCTRKEIQVKKAIKELRENLNGNIDLDNSVKIWTIFKEIKEVFGNKLWEIEDGE